MPMMKLLTRRPVNKEVNDVNQEETVRRGDNLTRKLLTRRPVDKKVNFRLVGVDLTRKQSTRSNVDEEST